MSLIVSIIRLSFVVLNRFAKSSLSSGSSSTTSLIILNRFYKGYYDKYIDSTHYGILYNNNEIYYKNFQIINKNFKLCVYPNKYNDKFFFTLKKDNKLNIKRIDSQDGWHFNLKILIIDKKNKEYLITIGDSIKNDKNIDLDFL